MGKLLTEFLTANKKDESTISKTLLRELTAVEEEIIRRKENVSTAERMIQNNAVNIKAISDATGISRKTFYNNKLLNDFVTANSTVDTVVRDETSKLKKKLGDTETKLNKLLYRNVDEIILLNEITKLQKELEYANKRVKVLEEQHEQDMRKLNQPLVKKNTIYS